MQNHTTPCRHGLESRKDVSGRGDKRTRCYPPIAMTHTNINTSKEKSHTAIGIKGKRVQRNGLREEIQ